MTDESSLLRGQLVYLAAQDPDRDAAIYARWTHDSEFLRLLDSEPARMRTAQYWKENIEQAFGNPGSFPFAIHALEQGRLIGFVALWILSWPRAEAMVDIGLGEAADRGRGYGTDAMRVALRYAFEEVNLERVTLTAFAHNARALRAYEKAGFVLEGREREWLRRDDQRHDHVSMGVLRADWLRARAAARSD